MAAQPPKYPTRPAAARRPAARHAGPASAGDASRAATWQTKSRPSAASTARHVHSTSRRSSWPLGNYSRRSATINHSTINGQRPQSSRLAAQAESVAAILLGGHGVAGSRRSSRGSTLEAARAAGVHYSTTDDDSRQQQRSQSSQPALAAVQQQQSRLPSQRWQRQQHHHLHQQQLSASQSADRSGRPASQPPLLGSHPPVRSGQPAPVRSGQR